MNLNRELAGATLAHLAALEVHHVVVCAGARNAPLVTSLLAMEGGTGWRVWNHFDERCAAFFALGLAKKSRKPTAVVTTSGTAVAEMLPAAIEAYYSGIPLILVSADRPPAYRGSGAPQAIEQPGIFGPYAPVSVDVQTQTDLSWVLKWSRMEPLHLNVCFEEPSPQDTVDSFDPVDLPLPKADSDRDEGISLEAFVANPRGLVVLIGELESDWRDPVEMFVAQLGVPVWAEATSGLRESKRLSELLIRQERQVAAFEPREILRIGGVPSLRFWRDLETQEGIGVMSVTRRPFSGLARLSRLLVCDRFPTPPEIAQQGQVSDPTLLHSTRFESGLLNHTGSEPAMMRALSNLIPSQAMVYLGNSLPIREWNLAASLDRAHPKCYASRGA
ncbi:MAG: 2-succinyl-5-enolpyruvyl-6-hydroxy-3-cyclohexene-1-carboxylic-acid synthase, partial [Verrucomicrobiota bacterium]